MPLPDPIYIGADHHVRWTGAKIEGTSTYLNAATVAFQLKNADGTNVTGGSGTCAYVAASSGNYLGVIESTVTAGLTEGAIYRLETTLVEGAYNDLRRWELVAQYRKKS